MNHETLISFIHFETCNYVFSCGCKFSFKKFIIQERNWKQIGVMRIILKKPQHIRTDPVFLL